MMRDEHPGLVEYRLHFVLEKVDTVAQNRWA